MKHISKTYYLFFDPYIKFKKKSLKTKNMQ